MAQVDDTSEKRHISSQMSSFPRDLLRGFISVNNHHLPLPHLKPADEETNEEDAEEEQLELTLGLSLNGRFGVDPKAKKIKRTSSIPELVNPARDEEMGNYAIPMPCSTPLMRTCSLPTETAEEWRKRKELQSLRRLEARRKRYEKQRRLKNQSFSEEIGDEGAAEGNLVEQGAGNLTREFTTSLGNNTTSLTTTRGSGLPPPSPSQGSIGSQGTGSSGISEYESQPVQGTKSSVDASSPMGPNSFPEGEQKLLENSSKVGASAMRNQCNKHASPENRTVEGVRSLLEDMPCVTTKGVGPNGKRIQGFLYRYRKGDEVRIVCVCHGSFLTPAEFVKHAGGGDVANPLKHIVVSPSFL